MSAFVHNSGTDTNRRPQPLTASSAADGEPAFSLVVIGASRGGLRAVKTLLAGLPAFFAAPIVVAQHAAPSAVVDLAEVVHWRTGWPVRTAAEGVRLQPGVAYVAPGCSHLAVQPGGVLAVREAPRAGLGRPSANVLFESAAAVYGPRVLGVVLTGSGRDGACGVQAIKRHGGRVLVQDPADCEAPGMPTAAIATGCIDFVLPLEALARALVALVMVPGAAGYFRVPVPAWAPLG